MLKEKIIINHIYPPSIAIINGQRYVFPGWIPVSDDITMEDIIHINPYAHLHKNNTILEDKEWNVKSSKGVKNYTIKRINNEYSCNCTGYGYRKTCSHIDKIKMKNE